MSCPTRTSFDAAFAQTLLEHLREPLRALREIKRVLKPGGVVGIADPDHGAMLREPPSPLVDDAHQLMMRVVKHNGGDNFRARRHRQLLREVGFARPVAGATTETVGAWGTPEDTRMFAAWEASHLSQPHIIELMTAQGWANQATLEAMAEATLAWGEHPDAFIAFLGVTAVGWKDA